MYEEFKHAANFITVYIQEAHPVDEWTLGDKVCVMQPKTNEDRLVIANDFVAEMQYKLPTGVDMIEGHFNKTYAAMPERGIIINATGKLAFIGKAGPYGFRAIELHDWLREYVKGKASDITN